MVMTRMEELAELGKIKKAKEEDISISKAAEPRMKAARERIARETSSERALKTNDSFSRGLTSMEKDLGEDIAPRKSVSPGENDIPGNILPGVDPRAANANIASGLTTDMRDKVTPRGSSGVMSTASKILGTHQRGLATEVAAAPSVFRKAAEVAREARVGSVGEGQFIGAEAPPVPEHPKLVIRPPVFFRSGNDMVTRKLKL